MSKQVKEEKTTKKDKKKNGDKTVAKTVSFVLIIVAVISIIGYLCFVILGGNGTKEKENTVRKNINEIEGYGITLDDLDTELYKSLYNELKDNLTGKNIDYEEYAKSISKMYIVDVFNIDNKINKYDLGGTELVWPKVVDNYKTNLMDTLYLYVEDNSRDQRDQSLPVVTSVDVDSIIETTYTYNNGTKDDKSDDVTYEGYKVKLSWDYRIKLGYDNEATLIVINDNNKLYIAEHQS